MSNSDKETAIQHDEAMADIQPQKTVDTVHKDEAMKVLAAYQGDELWTDEEEKRLRRKIDWRLMPVLCATYMLQYYDKAMLSQAVRIPAREPWVITDFICTGHIRAETGPWSPHWRSIRHVCLHLLSRLYRRGLPMHDTRTTISDRTSCFWDCYHLGCLPDLDSDLQRLQGALCTAILPRILGEWHQPYVHDDCRKCLCVLLAIVHLLILLGELL